jgi:hypothetical protein
MKISIQTSDTNTPDTTAEFIKSLRLVGRTAFMMVEIDVITIGNN